MEAVERFKVVLSTEQQGLLSEWLETARWVWNEGRSLLLEHEANTGSVYWVPDPEKPGKEKALVAPASPLARVNWFANEIEDKTVWAPHSWIFPKGSKGGTVNLTTGAPTHYFEDNLIRVRQCCPLPGRAYKEPRLGLDALGKFTLSYYFRQKRIKSKQYTSEMESRISELPSWVRPAMREGLYPPAVVEQFCNMPAWFSNGVCDDLWQAWSKYKSGEGGKPRYKRPNEATESLTHGDGAQFKISPAENGIDGYINGPKLGKILVKGLWEKWGETPVLVFQLVRRNGVWWLHLTGYKIQTADIFAYTKAIIAKYLLGSSGINCKCALFVLGLNLWALQHPTRPEISLTVPGDGYNVAVDGKGKSYSVLPHRASDGALDPHQRVSKLEAEILRLQRAASKREEVLKVAREAGDKTNKGKRLEATYRKIAKLRAKLALILGNNRKKIAEKLSNRAKTLTVVLKEADQKRKRKPKARPGQEVNPASYLPNGAERVAKKNKQLAGSAPGEFVALLQQEAKERAQIIRVVKPQKTGKKVAKKKGR